MPPKDQHAAGTPAPSTSSTPAPMASIAAGTPVQTYPSPAHATAHAQWAASAQIDPSLQQQATTSTAPTTAVATTTQRAATAVQHAPVQAAAATTTAAQNLTTQNIQAYYQNYAQHYPYYAQYITQALQQQQQQQQAATAGTTATTSTQPYTAIASTAQTAARTPVGSTAPTPVVSNYTPQVATIQTATAPAAAPASNSLDTNDISTLNDALGSAGVDLRAEEESLTRHDTHQHNTYHTQPSSSIYLQSRPYEDRSKKQPIKPAFNPTALGTTMRAIGTQHKVVRVPEEAVNYLALAVKARLQDLVVGMVKAAKYRKEAQFDRPASFYETLQGTTGSETKMEVDEFEKEKTPMWSIVVRSDVAKQLVLLERIEREEEMRIRRERKERLEMTAAQNAALAAQAAGAASSLSQMDPSTPSAYNGGGAMDEDMTGPPKKKKKKEGPGVTARNMSEDVRKKMSNAVATQAAGLGKYAWMNAAASSTPTKGKAAATPAPVPATPATPAAPAVASTSITGPGVGTPPATPAAMIDSKAAAAANTWARPYKKPTLPTAGSSTADQTQGRAEEDPNRIVVTLRDAMFVVEKERGHGGGRGAARGWT